MQLSERLLVVLTGPVGGGKSTVALALATQLRAYGHPTAVIDLDLVYRMARQRDGFADEKTWRAARRGAAVLTDAFFECGARVVVVEGGFFTQEEFDGLRDHVASSARLRFVTLKVSFEQALHRAKSDPNTSRVVSRDAEVLRLLHEQFAEALPFLRASSLVVDADQLSPIELARSIAESVLMDMGAS